jgi:hypothetical protein
MSAQQPRSKTAVTVLTDIEPNKQTNASHGLTMQSSTTTGTARADVKKLTQVNNEMYGES